MKCETDKCCTGDMRNKRCNEYVQDTERNTQKGKEKLTGIKKKTPEDHPLAFTV